MPSSLQGLPVLGRYFFGAGLLASGLMQLARGEFVRLVPKLPATIPWPGAWPLVSGAALVVVGGLIVAGKQIRAAAIATSVLLLAGLFARVPEIAVNPGAGYVWTNPCKVLALLGGTLLLPQAGIVTDSRLFAGRVLLAMFLLVGGVQHFVYAQFVHALVPEWLPARQTWTYFTGVALVAGGVGLLLPHTARLAATLSGVMIFLWVALLHIPRALAEVKGANETAGVFEALALSGVAFLASIRPSRQKM